METAQESPEQLEQEIEALERVEEDDIDSDEDPSDTDGDDTDDDEEGC